MMDETCANAKQGGDQKYCGILRIDIGKPRRSSGSSVEFRQPERLEQGPGDGLGPASPEPSFDRLSVTWADNDDPLSKVNLFTPGTPPAVKMEVRFPDEDRGDSEDEDYSASVSAIMQRRASTRRSRKNKGRRPSSPFSVEARRRSSVFTTSSAETAISIEESVQEVTQEQIFENIRIHKEVLSSVKQQPWGMKRKLRLVNQAKSYIKKHEGALQERLAQSRCSRDIFARFNIVLATKLTTLKREAANWSNWVIPWELRIKEIESHFGSVVASYFTFLRWLFWVNIVISIVLVVFVVVPEVLTADQNAAGERKVMLPDEKNRSTHFLTLWEFEGVLKYSPIFYGYYTNRDPGENGGYRLPLAYFMTGLAVYVYSFVATLRKMAENSRMSKLSEKEDECIFSWKLFTGWDYMIGNAETAHNRTASIILGFKEALLEEAEKKKDARNWKIIFQRVIANICVIFLLVVSAYAVVEVVKRSEKNADSNWWRQNEITIVMSLISFIFPIFFELLGLMEMYHPRKQLRIQLARIMVLNLLNLYSLIIALFDKITNMTKELDRLKPANTTTVIPTSTNTLPTSSTIMESSTIDYSAISSSTSYYDTTLGYTTENYTHCYEVAISCPTTIMMKNLTATLMTILFANATTSNININQTTLSVFNTSNFDYNNTGLYSTDGYYSYYSNATSNYDEYDDISEDYEPSSNTTESNNSTEGFNESTYSSTYTDGFDDITTTGGSYPSSTDSDPICYVTHCVNVSDLGNVPTGTMDSSKMDYIMDASYSALIQREYQFEKAVSYNLDLETRKKLRKLCWETMFGQELVKLTMMDLVMTIVATLFMDFFRAVFVRFMNSCWCWDLEKNFPQYGDFKIAENILHLVNNQGMVWMGMFFSPGLVVLNLVKLVILMYLRSWAVMTCNVPHEVVFRASRSNNFYLALLLTMLFLCVLPVGYAIVWVEPSWHCGPFSHYKRIYHLFTQSLLKILPKSLHRALDYIASPGIIIPMLVLLVLIIYYLLSLTGALREANNDLKIQLRRERTEERRKMFQIADKRRRGGSNDSENTPFSKWRKILPGNKASDLNGDDNNENNDKSPTDKKDLLAKIVKMALRKSSATSDDGSCLALPTVDDETDTEFHESLPEDVLTVKDIKFTKKHANKKSESNQRPASLTLENEVEAKKIKKKRHAKKSEHDDENKKSLKFRHRSHSESIENKEDSITSIIPVITISKTESDEDILDKKPKRKPNQDKSIKRQSSVESLPKEKETKKRSIVKRDLCRSLLKAANEMRDETAQSNPHVTIIENATKNQEK